MKICRKCGAAQSDERRMCIDCGETLGPPVDKKTAEEYNKKLGNKVSKLTSSGDFLALKPLDVACGIAMILCGVASGVIFLFPRFASDGRTLFAMIFVLGIVLGLNALLPKLVWLLEKLRLSATVDNTDDLIPSGWYIISRKLAIYLGAVLVVSMFSFALYAAVRLSIISNIGGIIQ